MRFFFLISLLFASTIQAQELGGVSPKVKFNELSNKQAKIVFPKGWQANSSNVLEIFAQLDSTTKTTLGNKTKRWNVVMQHNTVVPNAYVRMAPLRSEFFLTPDMDNLQNGTLPWVQLLATHEYRHIQQFSNFNNGITKLFSLFLGQQGQLLANGIAVPDYFFEGDAVFQETITTQQGRGMLPSFFTELKALEQAGLKRNWMQLRNGSFKYILPSHYPLGYQVVAYGYETQGTDFWRKITKDATSFKGLFYPWGRAIKKHSGISYRKFRDSALQYFSYDITEKDKQEANAFLVSKKPKTVTNYNFLQAINETEMVYIKSSFDKIPAFYKRVGDLEIFIANRHISQDQYFDINNNKIIYSSYTKDPRYDYTNYSNIVVLDIATKKHQAITIKGKYFHPAWDTNNDKIVATHVDELGNYSMHILNNQGKILNVLQQNRTQLHTYPKFYKNNSIVSIVRNADGTTQIAQTDIVTNKIDKYFTSATYKAMGYPQLDGDTLWFSITNNNSEQLAALDLTTEKMHVVTSNYNSFYYPCVTGSNLYFSKVTEKGQLLSKMPLSNLQWTPVTTKELNVPATNYLNKAFANRANLQLANNSNDTGAKAHNHKRGLNLFNFHSLQPSYSEPEWGLSLFTDNILNNLSGNVNYVYNNNETSHTYGVTATYAGLFPFLNIGASTTQNRTVTLAGTDYSFSTAKIYAGFNIPLTKYKGAFYRSANIAYTFNTEQVYYNGISKNIFKNEAYQYGSLFLSASNQITKARQHINPRWAQAASISFRDGYNFINNKKLVANGRFFFPGLKPNHSLVIQTAFQTRDTLRDYFTNNFSYARGYQALNTRRMGKVGLDYYFPIWYPDFGFANLLFIQRIRGNIFYDYNRAKARVSGVLINIINRSAGMEAYADIKIWNAFPLTIGVRYSRLLDTDLLNPTEKNIFQIVLPLDIIPR